MKMALISDVHSNLVALQAVRDDILFIGTDIVYDLGDTVGYGPRPAEALHLVLTMCKEVLMGNHEDALCNPEKENDLNKYAAEGIQFSRSKFDASIVNMLNVLPKVIPIPEHNLILCHGSFTEPQLWKYIDRPQKAKEELKYTPQKICVVGHTHSPFVFGSKKGLYEYLPDDLVLDPEQKYIINVGSVGQPRDGDCRACYGVIEWRENDIIFNIRRVFYDIGKTEKDMREAGISKSLSERLFSGS